MRVALTVFWMFSAVLLTMAMLVFKLCEGVSLSYGITKDSIRQIWASDQE